MRPLNDVGARKKKVLVVDDDPFTLEIVRRRLERIGYQVVARTHPIGTSKVILDERPDVVLLDVNMPALSGPMLAEIVTNHQHLSGTGIIFHSSEHVSRMSALAKKIGALGYIEKTADDTLFIHTFQRLMCGLQSRRP